MGNPKLYLKGCITESAFILQTSWQSRQMWTVSWAKLDAHESKRKLVGRKWFTSNNGTFYRACKYFWTVQFDSGLPTSYNRDRSHSYKWLSTSIHDRPLSSSTSESSSNNQFGPSSFTIVRTVHRHVTAHFKVYNIKYNLCTVDDCCRFSQT